MPEQSVTCAVRCAVLALGVLNTSSAVCATLRVPEDFATIQAAVDAAAVQILHGRHESATNGYHERVAVWNQEQKRRARQGRSVQTAGDFLAFLGVV